MSHISALKNLLSAYFIVLTLHAYGQSKDEKKVKAKSLHTGMYNSSDNKEAMSYYSEAYALHNAEKYKEAIDVYKKALKKDPNFVEVYDNIAVCYRRLGDFKNAIKHYKKSIELYPEGTMAHMNLGLIYGIQKDYNNAIMEYKALQKIDPDNAEGYYGTINIYLQKKDYKSAIRNAQKTLEIYEATNSQYIADALYLLGFSYYSNGDKKNAKFYFAKAQKKGATIPDQIKTELKMK